MRGTRLQPLSTRVIAFAIGSACVGAGVGAMIRADLGVTPVDVLNTGIADHLEFDVGVVSWAAATVMSAVAWALGRRPNIGTFAGSALVGGSIVLVLRAAGHIGHDRWLLRAGLLVAGLVVVYVGINGIVASGVGTGPLELVMLALGDRGWRLDVARWTIEAVIFAAGLALGGQVGLGTALFALCTGPVLARSLPPAMRWMGTDAALPPVAVR